METIFGHAGGYPPLHRFVDIFYSSVLADPLLQPLSGTSEPQHVAHLTALGAESFGGPDDVPRWRWPEKE
jgi:hemoglobin